MKSIFIFLILYTRIVYGAFEERPRPFQFITDVPSTLKSAWDLSFNTKKETLYAWGGIFLSTGLLIYYDEEILSEFQRFGRKIGIGNGDGTTSFLKVGSINIFRGPTDVGSTLYYLGDGWTHAFIGLGFVLTGLAKDSNRTLTTGSQIFNGMISSTIVNQIAKRSFGRESPYRKSAKRGRWRPFPSFSTYNNNISKYDAMPTGHLMTATMTFTIIDENYPEQRYWLRPFALTWMALLGYQMVNNGVHWISDYPLGIMMGYVFGKAAAKSGQTEVSQNGKWNFLPIYEVSPNEHVYGVAGLFSF
ncbi:MAG: phosphatase PAP2 family protein [Halobacteriovoraceae bacterium]|nr:phosphatase PAP2 family protein [Halobacteriovoraceae bacterium]